MHRNQGIGKAFFGELALIAQEKVKNLWNDTSANADEEQNCARIDWAVLNVGSFLHMR